MNAVVIVLLVLVVGLSIRIPISYILIGAATIYYALSPGPSLLVAQRLASGLESFPLLAIPFFILAGTAMAHGGIAERLLGFADSLVGHVRGGLGQVNVLNSLMMGGMSGSANADAAIDAKILVPIMEKNGYDRHFSSALSAASGIIAPLIPPGIGLIIYGLLAEVSIGKLFVAGIVPGILVAIGLAIVVRIISVRRGYGASRTRRADLGTVLRKGRESIWAFMMPVLLIVGLRMGVMTPTELGAVAALYAIFVGVVIHREIKLRQLYSILNEAAQTSAIVMLIIAGAAAFGGFVTLERIPQKIVGALQGVSDSPIVLLLLINVALILLGTIMESTSLLVLITPILAGMAAILEIDPVQLGLVVVLNLTIGGVTPPVGTIMYTVTAITRTTVLEFAREVWPFLVALIGVLLLITYVPWFTTWLPNLLF